MSADRSRRHLVADLGDVESPQIDLPVREPRPDDIERLAALMLDAYRGTIDFDGDETLSVARDEVASYLAGKSGTPLLEHSHVALAGERIVSAVLVSDFEGTPLIAYLFTAADQKGRGLGDTLTRMAMCSLAAAGRDRVHLWVTAGNVPAERIYERLGFTDVAG
jgi:ribosomal protein S18 acetylase RimI-like enzyme